MLNDVAIETSLFAPIDFSQMRKSDLGISLLDNRLYASRLRNVRRQLFTSASIPSPVSHDFFVMLCYAFATHCFRAVRPPRSFVRSFIHSFF